MRYYFNLFLIICIQLYMESWMKKSNHFGLIADFNWSLDLIKYLLCATWGTWRQLVRSPLHWYFKCATVADIIHIWYFVRPYMFNILKEHERKWTTYQWYFHLSYISFRETKHVVLNKPVVYDLCTYVYKNFTVAQLYGVD